MYSFIIFLVLLIQSTVVGGAYLMGDAPTFYNLAVYGSPFYSAMTLLRSDSPLLENNPLYLTMLIYHFFKYGIFYLAQRNEGLHRMLYTAIFMEICYLLTSAYFLN